LQSHRRLHAARARAARMMAFGGYLMAAQEDAVA
jgi:hypothetical protein